MDATKSYSLKRNAGLAFGWWVFAVFCAALAVMPWWMVMQNTGPRPPTSAFLFFGFLTAAFLAVCMWLVFSSVARTTLSLTANGGLRVRRAIGPVGRGKVFDQPVRLIWVTQHFHSRYGGPTKREAILLEYRLEGQNKRYRIANDLEYRRLDKMIDWWSLEVGLPADDLRRRALID
ncbi:MAG: hypothetical protein AAGH92_13590 [Planctomycetota bacterium]